MFVFFNIQVLSSCKIWCSVTQSFLVFSRLWQLLHFEVPQHANVASMMTVLISRRIRLLGLKRTDDTQTYSSIYGMGSIKKKEGCAIEQNKSCEFYLFFFKTHALQEKKYSQCISEPSPCFSLSIINRQML